MLAQTTGEPAGGNPPAGGPGGPTGGANPPAGPTGGGISTPGSTGRPGQTNIPGLDQRNPFPQMDRTGPVFLSGKVTLEDGTPPPAAVTIERLCNGGSPRPEGYTDSKGRFSFQLGQNIGVLPDASVSSNSDEGFGNTGNARTLGGAPGSRGFTERDLMGCELRASLPGFRSQNVSLTGRRFLDNPDVGTIILRRLANVEGLTTSMTTLMAPKDARKAYEKAQGQMKKNKAAEALKELEVAVGAYPKYAIAWNDLGMLYESGGKKDEARAAYMKAIDADAKFVKPYIAVAAMDARENKWEEVAAGTGKIIKMNPYDFPSAYFLGAVAAFNLQKTDEAEKLALDGIKQDVDHRVPKLNHVLGVIQAQKGDFTPAAENMKAYLKFAPKASDADNVRKQLADIEAKVAQNVPAATSKQ